MRLFDAPLTLLRKRNERQRLASKIAIVRAATRMHLRRVEDSCAATERGLTSAIGHGIAAIGQCRIG